MCSKYLIPFRCIYHKHYLVISNRRLLFHQIPVRISFCTASHLLSKPKQNVLQEEFSQDTKRLTNESPEQFPLPNESTLPPKTIIENYSKTISNQMRFSPENEKSERVGHSKATSTSKSSPHQLKFTIPEEPSEEDVPSPLQRFFLGRFLKYLKKFRESLATEMPDTFHILDTFMNGLKEFLVDLRDYLTVVVKLSLPFYNLEDLGRRELQLYFNMPRQMIRVFPVVAISSLPFAQNFVLPIAYMFPKHLLCYHFWDAKQREEFPSLILRKRLFNARPVFRSLQTRVEEVEDPKLQRKCLSICFSLGSGVHPLLSHILEVKQLFIDGPFQLNLLWAQHVNGLLRLHNRSALFRRRKRLKEHARYLHCMDRALQKEGVNTLDSELLRNMLLLRGINPIGMTDEEMENQLNNWLFISKELDEAGFSLLLHLPILLAYNHPLNLQLMYS